MRGGVDVGQLVNGQWVDDDVVSKEKAGEWTRTPTIVRDWIRADGSTEFAAETGRYHLWLAYNCTWSQRTMIVLNLLGLDQAVSTSMAHVHRNEGGWWFREGIDAVQPKASQTLESWSREDGFQPAEPVKGLSLHTVYTAHDPTYTGRCTVPTLWDRKLGKVVNNESSEIVRMFEHEFNAVARTRLDLRPAALRTLIDDTNHWVYDGINNGVYKVGFAGSQAAYEVALDRLFSALDRCESILAGQRYLCGNVLTESDIRLFPTLVRFDPVYFGHFKCNTRRIADYQHLSGYLRDLYQMPAFARTVNVQAYKLGYMGRSERLNPSRIIPPGPALDWDAPCDEREAFSTTY
ncbi:MAG: putative glutathione S-transferase [Myxococcota bacterium]|jgi:putative glutathione S-transferase